MQNKKSLIIIASAVSFPYGNASDNAIYTFIDGFQERGCNGEVVCLYPNMPKSYEGISADGEYKGVKYSFLSKRVHPKKNIFLHILDFWIYPIFLFFKYIRAKSKSYKLNVLFVDHVSFLFFIQTLICKLFRAKVTLISCEYPMYLTKHPNSVSLYRFYSRYIDKYVFETKTLEDFEKKQLNKEIRSIVIPATMPFDDIVGCPKDLSEVYIAYSGSIFSDTKDGLSNIIKAFKLFSSQNPHVGLRFIGRIANKLFYEELLQLVEELQLSDKVKFTGEVNRTDYVHQMNNASLMIVAKPKDSYYVGGLSSKVIEYLFSGNPIIMTAADDYVHYLTHKENVYFTKDNSPEELSEAMLDVFSDNDLRLRIAHNGKKYAMENFNYHVTTGRMLEFILKES